MKNIENINFVQLLKTDKKGRLTILLMFLLLLCGYFGSYLLGVLFICISLALIHKPIYLLPVLFLSSLLGDYFVALPGNSIARLLSFEICISVMIMMSKKKYVWRKSYLYLLLFFLIYIFISSVTSYTGNFQPFFRLVINVLVVFALANIRSDRVDSLLSLLYYCCIIMSFYMAFLLLSGELNVYADRISMAEGINSNRTAIAVVQITAILIGYSAYRNFYSKSFMLVFVLNLSVLLLTGSRSSTIALLLGSTIVYILWVFPNQKNRLRTLVIVTILFVFCLGIFSFLQKQYPNVMQRFSVENVTENNGTGRVDTWGVLWEKVIPNNLLFGVGYGGDNELIAVQKNSSLEHQSHNIVMSLVTQIGIVGLLIYSSLYMRILKSNILAIRFDLIYIIPLMIFVTGFINGIGETIYDEKFLWNAVGLFFLIKYNSVNHK